MVQSCSQILFHNCLGSLSDTCPHATPFSWLFLSMLRLLNGWSCCCRTIALLLLLSGHALSHVHRHSSSLRHTDVKVWFVALTKSHLLLDRDHLLLHVSPTPRLLSCWQYTIESFVSNEKISSSERTRHQRCKIFTWSNSFPRFCFITSWLHSAGPIHCKGWRAALLTGYCSLSGIGEKEECYFTGRICHTKSKSFHHQIHSLSSRYYTQQKVWRV